MDRDDRVLAVASLYHACNDASVILLPALFPILQGVFSMSYADIGLLSGFGLLVTIAGQLFAGRLGDRRSQPRLLAVGMAILGIGLLLVPLASSFAALFLIVIVARVGASFYHPVGISWLSLRFGGRGLDRAMGLQSSAGDVGVIFGMVSAGFLAAVIDWRAPFLVWGAINLVAAALGLWLAPRQPGTERPARAKPERTSIVLRQMSPFLAAIVASGAIYSITVNLGPLLLTDRYGMSTELADAVIGLWIGLGAVSAYLYARYSTGERRRAVLAGSYLALTASGALVYLLDQVYLASLFLVVSGAALLLSYPAVFSLFSRAVGKEARGSAFGVFFSLNLAGGAAASYLAGLAADAYGIRAPFLAIAAIALATAVVSLAMIKSTPGNA